MGPNYLLYLHCASQVRSATAIHNATSCPAPCQSCVRSRSAVGSGRCMLVGCPLDLLFAQARAAAADLSSLAPVNTPECNQLNLPIKCSAGHASHAQPWRSPGTHRHAPGTLAHTGTLPAHWHTPARSRHAPRHTNTQAAVVSFLHSSISLPPHASRPAASRTVKTANPERKSRTGNSSSLLLSCLSALPQDPQQQSVAPPNAPPAATAAANAANAANAAPARRQHHAPQLQRPLPRHQPSGAP